MQSQTPLIYKLEHQQKNCMNGKFYYRLCFAIMRSVAIRSLQDLFCLKPAFSPLHLVFFILLILSRMILLSTLPGTDRSMIPL
jgi:hypothetical protein